MADNKVLKGINFPGLEGTYYIPEAKAVKDENGYIEIQSYVSDTVEVENLDTTLTKEGYAADAKAVGDALQNKVNVVEGSRLMTAEEANKLAKLVIDEDGNAMFAGTYIMVGGQTLTAETIAMLNGLKVSEGVAF